MPIQSMTGFGKSQVEGEKYTLSVEIKTVNNRFKDFRFKMGSVFNGKEIEIRKKLEKKFKRGSFDIYVNYKKNAKAQETLELDFNKIEKIINEFSALSEKTRVPVNFAPTDFFRSDFAIEDESKEEELVTLLDKALEEAVANLLTSRHEEGKSLVAKLKEHKETYSSFYKEIITLKDSYQDNVREKLKTRFDKELTETKIDEGRFLQEVIYYMEKLDVDEEITRIQIHLAKLDKILSSDGEVGRQIDFLIQELNRETNTIGSKSGSSEISENVVQMKVQLEKIREQALNME